MKLSGLLFASLLLFSNFCFAQADEQKENETRPSNTAMTQTKMLEIIKSLADDTQGEANNIIFTYNDVSIALVSDLAANRMRLVTAVAEASELSQEQIIASLVSNYHLALDARYAIGNGILYSTYIHPLAELTEKQLLSAVRQVATLSKTFGTSYTSGELSFGVEVEEDTIDI